MTEEIKKVPENTGTDKKNNDKKKPRKKKNANNKPANFVTLGDYFNQSPEFQALYDRLNRKRHNKNQK